MEWGWIGTKKATSFGTTGGRTSVIHHFFQLFVVFCLSVPFFIEVIFKIWNRRIRFRFLIRFGFVLNEEFVFLNFVYRRKPVIKTPRCMRLWAFEIKTLFVLEKAESWWWLWKKGKDNKKFWSVLPLVFSLRI